jgi:tRNA (cmo5U34)-methyltransferase
VTQSDPAGVHDWHSASYVGEWIEVNSDGDRSASLRMIAHLVPFDPDEPIHVLDIGGGWGPVTETMLQTFAHAQVVLHDFSEPMLAEARRRLTQHGASVSYHRGDLTAPRWADGLDGPFDAIVSHIAIHNVRFPDRIRAIYHEIFPLVAPGGCFVNLDHPASGELVGRATRHAQLMARRQQFYEETGRWPALDDLPASSRFGRNPHAHGEASREDRERMAAHEPATVANQLNWLREAGFDEAECFWREARDALIGAFRH